MEGTIRALSRISSPGVAIGPDPTALFTVESAVGIGVAVVIGVLAGVGVGLAFSTVGVGLQAASKAAQGKIDQAFMSGNRRAHVAAASVQSPTPQSVTHSHPPSLPRIKSK